MKEQNLEKWSGWEFLISDPWHSTQNDDAGGLPRVGFVANTCHPFSVLRRSSISCFAICQPAEEMCRSIWKERAVCTRYPRWPQRVGKDELDRAAHASQSFTVRGVRKQIWRSKPGGLSINIPWYWPQTHRQAEEVSEWVNASGIEYVSNVPVRSRWSCWKQSG
jgi:hypothetical protein